MYRKGKIAVEGDQIEVENGTEAKKGLEQGEVGLKISLVEINRKGGFTSFGAERKTLELSKRTRPTKTPCAATAAADRNNRIIRYIKQLKRMRVGRPLMKRIAQRQEKGLVSSSFCNVEITGQRACQEKHRVY